MRSVISLAVCVCAVGVRASERRVSSPFTTCVLEALPVGATSRDDAVPRVGLLSI